jgi:4-oxalocrotonate tautomerase
MPFLTVRILAGRSSEQKGALVRDLTEAMSRNLNVEPERVNVVIHEVEPGNWARGGKLLETDKEVASPTRGGAGSR